VWGTPLRQWFRTLEFRYPAVEMDYLTPIGIRRLGRKVLLPLLPLTEGGAEWDVVQGVLHDLEFEDRELLKIAFGMAMRCVSEEYREPLKKEYHMIYDELRADPLFREMLGDERKEGREEGREEGRQEGRQEGALQTAQQIAVRLVANRFPELEKLAKIVIAAVSDVERLQMLIIELSIASCQDQARELLFSLTSDS